jgi:beta-lactamase regulating signal transducer with metallopeptidase domain
MTFDALAVWGLQTGLMVSLLIGLVLIIRRPFARYFGANAAYALWLLPLGRLFMPSFTLPFITKKIVEAAPISTVQSNAITPMKETQSEGLQTVTVEATPVPIPEAGAEPLTQAGTAVPSQTAETVTVEVVTDNSQSVSATINSPTSSVSASPSSPSETSGSSSVDFLSFLGSLEWVSVLVALWVGIAVVWFGLQLFRQQRFMRHMRRTAITPPKTLDAPIQAAMEAIGLKRRPALILSSHVRGPMVTGVARPLILLPEDFETQFKPHQRSFALIHEMAHIKRGDLWVALMMLAYRALFWFNPLIHYAAHKMRIDQEAACDASVIAKTGGETATHSYAETLIHAAKSAGQAKTASPLGLAMTDDKP